MKERDFSGIGGELNFGTILALVMGVIK